jgi:hypothetical protein
MNINSTTILRLPIPLDQAAYESATRFAAEQATPSKGKQVYLNTLAVCAVHTYLKWLEIETDLTQSDCWQPGLRAVLDIADLEVPGVGKLECRPMLSEADSLAIPFEATQDRIGYIAVQFHEQLGSVELLGFVRAAASDTSAVNSLIIHQSELLSLDSLLDALHPEAIVNLRKWLEEVFEYNWREPAELASIRSSNIGGAKAIVRVKQIGQEFDGQKVGLRVHLSSVDTENFNVQIRLFLVGESSASYLPPGIQLLVLDENNVAVMQRQAQESESWIEHELRGRLGERFSVEIQFRDISVIESFQI